MRIPEAAKNCHSLELCQCFGACSFIINSLSLLELKILNIAEVERNLEHLIENLVPETFIYQLLESYGKPKSAVTRLQKGSYNSSKDPSQVLWKNNVLFKKFDSEQVLEDLYKVSDELTKSDASRNNKVRFVIVTDFKQLLAKDVKTGESLITEILQLPRHAAFFLPWAGQEKQKSINENPADRNAAYRMAKLYDEICRENNDMSESERHSLNVFLSRILFCYFAEDTEIFPIEGMFTSAIASHTQADGSDVDIYLDKLFEAMNKENRSNYPAHIEAFPWVNGGLFDTYHKAPKFSRAARKILIECGELDWSMINPDIFGSMIQAVVHPGLRSEIGMHYTSVSNIMKVIQSLFLDDLYKQMESNQDNAKGLQKLLDRLYHMKIFDPACGSGNFLIIAYKELRTLEIAIYERLRELRKHERGVIFLPQIRLTQFCGIEIDDFAHEIAILSLWLAEHQMNVRFKEHFGQRIEPLPLRPSGFIRCANANRIDWGTVCKKDDQSEIYVLGNPPYLGARNQNPEQKKDIDIVLGEIKGANNLDYIACWFYKASNFLKENPQAKAAFVTTNSICQGEQVSLLWPHVLFDNAQEIFFAHRSFQWHNSAKYNAGVTVAIIGLQNKTTGKKALFSGKSVQSVDNIGPYLIRSKNTIVYKRNSVLADLPEICFGSMANDGGHLFLTAPERDELLDKYPQAEKFLKHTCGSEEFIHGRDRFCLWIEERDQDEARSIPPIAKRIELVRTTRAKSDRAATQKLSNVPYRFAEVRHKNTNSIIIPSLSSERREYIPMGFLDENTVITNLAFAVYDAEPWVFSVLCSSMHNAWTRIVAGRFRTDIRYSSGIVYNNFPLPELNQAQKDSLFMHVSNIIDEREKYTEKSFAQLYDAETMPAALRLAHKELDLAVDACFTSKQLKNEEERIAFLFKLYEEAVPDQRRETDCAVV